MNRFISLLIVVHVVVEFGVRQGLVDVVEVHALGCVVSLNRLQTGDVTKEGGSRETAEHQYRVLPGRYLPDVHWVALVIHDIEILDHLTDVRCRRIEAIVHPSRAGTHAHTHTGRLSDGYLESAHEDDN